ncbi:hypothetical protein HFTV1-gp24 [Haloferax tailed virus 1]|uniref:Uncharacterized protein n=1 Tax=Haloferax tailed virus 1 TaxID=2507575 RepID=A0A410N6R4_HFTV1|nr:hypothetical protein M1M17_gp24 [Haloferax tailed virus 1]QAS68857.1 hypothetical protein HFTV1-gp24 [Haloferax tailed virus 1]
MTEDKRPYIYTNFQTTHGSVELTVEGSEGESTSDIEGVFDDKLEKVVDAQTRLDEDDDEKRGVQ